MICSLIEILYNIMYTYIYILQITRTYLDDFCNVE